MKTKLTAIFITIFFISISSCKKSQVNENSNIVGTYKGGTLHWNNANGTSGTDPNFSFTVQSINSGEIKLSINTTAPIPINHINLPLTDKSETGGIGQYTFSVDENASTFSKTFLVSITSTSPNNNYAQINYIKTSSSSENEDFDGEGFLTR